MKKIAKILLPLALCFVLLAGCGQKVEWANPEDYQDHPYQDLSLGELADRSGSSWPKMAGRRPLLKRAATSMST